MSSRALRKAQREREEQETLRRLQAEADALEEDEEEEEEDDGAPAPSTKQSVFAMLGEGQEEEDEHEDPDTEDEPSETDSKSKPSNLKEADQDQATAQKSTSSKKKKKKSKGKGAGKKPSQTPSSNDASLDEIDLALKSLSTKSNTASGTATPTSTIDPAVAETCRLLSTDPSHLHASNEMRRLFGRAALERDDDDDAAGGRRRNRGQQQPGLAAALRGRQAQGGRTSGLAALSLRRNIFIQGKEDWPVATSGGLGMELVEKRSDGTVEYRYTHTRPYQDVQSQFEDCVASMDPNRMVQLLQYNPYHISTLLQVSEIAKQERDHTTAGDLLERALFSFGRSVHSTFTNNLTQGKARMDFRRPENREFWLAACRYIANLGMRSTWRTVYEWSKLLLSLDPENDPYCMSLVIDQYALRARSPQTFLDMTETAFFSAKWKQLANIQLSRGLALVQTGQEGKGKQALFTAVSKHPFVVARLFQELNIDPPPAVWGKQPRTDKEKLHCELYAVRAKDLWNTPEASNLLAEVSSALSNQIPEPPLVDKDITLDEGRHVLMSDTPALIANLPRSITAKVTSSADPLPPDDDLPSYTPSSASVSGPRGMHAATRPLGTPAENLRELHGLRRFFADVFPWFNTTGEADEPRPQPTMEETARRIQESGVSEEVIIQRTQRLMELETSLGASVGDDEEEDGEGGPEARDNSAAIAARHAHLEEVEDEEA